MVASDMLKLTSFPLVWICTGYDMFSFDVTFCMLAVIYFINYDMLENFSSVRGEVHHLQDLCMKMFEDLCYCIDAAYL